MRIQKHGLLVGIERVGSDFFLSFKVQGKLTHEDYKAITPMIDSALAAVQTPKVKALIDVSELEGWEMRAAWDDFKLGLKHGSDFERVAVCGNRNWQEIAAKIGGWFMSAEIESFNNQEDAISWLRN